ncbi:MAG TPA: hypothetical protein VLB03_06175 [Nocardioidaceae bacterium]|nr:hypothetical protein [Nocardioidaceae bacterium]
MGPLTITRLASAATVAAVTTLALAVPATASETGSEGGASDTTTSQGANTRRAESVHGAGAVVVFDGTERTASVHDATSGVWQETPLPSDTGTATSEALQVAAGALGGLALVGVGFAAVVVVRRHHEHGGMAHPA